VIRTPNWSRCEDGRSSGLVVWRIRHDHPLPHTVLDADEAAQCARFIRREDRQRCAWGRLLARFALGRRCGRLPGEIAIVRSAGGKPFCAGGPDFNLSHGGDWVLLAVDDAPIGVDVEPVRDRRLAEELAPRIASDREQAWLAQDPGQRFTVLWTRKEAMLKRSGAGLVDDLAGVDALAAPDVLSFAVDARHVGAVAHTPGAVPRFADADSLLG